MTTQLQPYLNFDTNAEEAMNYYKGIFGGELTISRFSDFAPPDAPKPDNAEGVMHSVLKSDDIVFMASDGMADQKVQIGNNVHLSLMGDDEAKLTEYFKTLSADGSIQVPLAKQMWGDTFGMLTDKYGFHWMVNISATPAA